MAVSAYELALSQRWHVQQEWLETILSIAKRENEGPEAVATQLGRPLTNARTVTIRDGVAIVPVLGPIFRRANLFTELSGATSIEVLAQDLRKALSDPQVHSILLEVDSPGGQANGIAEMAEQIRQAGREKPCVAYVGGMGASAGYWLAAAADELVISSTAELGSIGTVAGVRREADPRIIEFVSSQSPHKRPDPNTEGGRAEITRVLDDLTEVFVASVARYRGTSVKKVLSDFGQGGLLIGEKAVAAGMADRVSSFEETLAGLVSRRGRPGPAPAAQTTDDRKAPTAAAGAETGARPRNEVTMPDTEVEGRTETPAQDDTQKETTQAAAPGVDAEVLKRRLDELEKKNARLEAESAALTAAAATRETADALAGMKFGDGGRTLLAPKSRESLCEALMTLPSDHRKSMLESIQSLQFVETGERGFTAGENSAGGEDVQLSATDEALIEDEAKRKGQKVEVVRAAFVESRKKAMAAGRQRAVN